MGFAEFLLTREEADQFNAYRESAEAARDVQQSSEAHRAWRELQQAVRNTAEGKRYKGELFVWRALSAHPSSLVLKNVAASFLDREWDSRTFTLLLAGIPGMHPLWATTSPDPEFIDLRFMGVDRCGRDRWLIGGSMEELNTAGENGAAETICRAFVTYFDDHQRSHGKPVI